MKAPLVALAATAAGFAAASAYLYGELSVERVRTQAEVEARSRHEARSHPPPRAIEFVPEGESTRASVMPFSQLQSSRFAPPSVGPKDTVLTSSKPATDPFEFNPREDRAPASRLERRLMRERSTLPEPPPH